MKSRNQTTVHLKPAPPTTTFTPSKATKQAAHAAALGLGRSVLQHIAQELCSRGETCFNEDGSPTDTTDGELVELASDGLRDWLDSAMRQGWLNRDVVNQTREELGLDPLA